MKYTEITVKPFVYVSSSYDYFVDVLCKINGEPSKSGCYFCKQFYLNSEMFMLSGSQPGYDESMPKYAIQAVLQQLSQMIIENKIKPYEYNRDGSKRWEDLKYYDYEDLKEWHLKYNAVTSAQQANGADAETKALLTGEKSLN